MDLSEKHVGRSFHKLHGRRGKPAGKVELSYA